MGIMAEIMEILSNPNREAERATPEMVIALAVHKEERKKTAADSRKDGEEEV